MTKRKRANGWTVIPYAGSLRISPRTLQTFRDNGTLAFTKIGNRTYYRPEDVERVISDVEDRRKEAKWKSRDI